MKIKRWQLIVIIIATIVVMIGSIFIGINLFSDNNEANKQTNYLADTSSSKVVKEMRGEVPVPLGYNYVSGDKNTGLIVQDETTNNKYMWIPYSEVKEDANVDNGTYLNNMTDEGKRTLEEYDGFYVMIDENTDNLYEKYKNNFIQQYEGTLNKDQLDSIKSELDKMSFDEYKTYYKEKTGKNLEITDISKDEYVSNSVLSSNEYNKNNAIITSALTKEELACVNTYAEKIGTSINISEKMQTFTLASEKDTVSLGASSNYDKKLISEVKQIKDGKEVPIPNGFVFEEYIGEDNRSIKIKNGDNLSYVWVPVSNIEDLENASSKMDDLREVDQNKRFDVKYDDEYDEMLSSIKKYGGYYVSEAELSINNDGQKSNKYKSMNLYDDGNYGIDNGSYYRNFSDNKETVLNSLEQADEIAKGLYSSSEIVNSHVMYGNEYDYMLLWIMDTNGDEIKNKMLTDSSTIGKYKVEKDEDGNDITNGLWNDTLLNGMFGLGGNLWEITKATVNGTTAIKGGSFQSRGSENPITYKRWVTTNKWEVETSGRKEEAKKGTIGLRVSFYIKEKYEENEELAELKKKKIEEFEKYASSYDDTVTVKSIKEYVEARINAETSATILDKIVNYGKSTLDDNYKKAVELLYNAKKEYNEKYHSKIDEILGIIYNTEFQDNEGKLTNYIQLAESKLAALEVNNTAIGDSFRLVAHKGYHEAAAENTIEAFNAAKEKGFKYIETDVSFTSDNYPLISNDSLKDLTNEQAHNVIVGNNNEKRPSFEEFIVWCKENNMYPYIELKDEETLSKENAEKLVDTIVDNEMENKVTWIDYSIGSLEQINNVYNERNLKGLRVGLLCNSITDASGTFIERLNNIKSTADVFIDANQVTCTDDEINRIKDENIELEVYTALNEQTVNKFIDTYITGVTSNVYVEIEGKKNSSTEEVKEEIAEEYAGGNGTKEDPYQISTAGQLTLLAEKVNNGEKYTDTYFELTNSIDINGQSWWPIGGMVSLDQNEITNYFEGNFEGNNNTIKNMDIYITDAAYVGLFGYVKDAHISNLNVESKQTIGSRAVGGICGVMEGKSVIENCNVIGNVKSILNWDNTELSIGFVGGIVGYMIDGEIKNCENNAIVTTPYQQVGGIVGAIESGKISDCKNTGKVIAYFTEGIQDPAVNNSNNSGNIAGGIAGSMKAGSITKCINTAEVKAESQEAGGIVGAIESGTIDSCTNEGRITAKMQKAGGIAGFMQTGKIIKSSNTGTITAKYIENNKYSGINAGDIVGYNAKGEISDCTNTGKVANEAEKNK